MPIVPEGTRPPPLRVCYFGTYRKRYSRNLIMIQSLRASGVHVMECHVPLWKGIEDRVRAASGGWLRPGFLLRLLSVAFGLILRYLRSPRHDVVVVGYPGHLDVFLAKILATLRGVPVVWDVFMSAYLVAGERGLHERSPLTARVLKAVEGLALRIPDLLIQDTAQYVSWFHRVHRTPEHWFRLVPTGADDTVYRPPESKPVSRADARSTILYYGTYIPNHGVEHIVRAADVLRTEKRLEFVLIGDGPERPAAEKLAADLGLTNLRFLDWMEREELVRHIVTADICLGAFGTTPQSLMTIQNKIYECLALGRPLITGDSPAIRDSLTPGTHLAVCSRADPRSLAGAVKVLVPDRALRSTLSREGRAAFRRRFSIRALGARFSRHLTELTGHRGRRNS